MQPALDGDKSPAESGVKPPHSKAVRCRRLQANLVSPARIGDNQRMSSMAHVAIDRQTAPRSAARGKPTTSASRIRRE